MIISNLPQFGKLDAKAIYSTQGSWKVRAQKALETAYPFKKIRKINLICLDAPIVGGGNYDDTEIKHLFKKLYASSLAIKNNYKNRDRVTWVFGNWGGGAFNNNLIVIYSIFLITTAFTNILKPRPTISADIYPMNSKKKFILALNLVEQSIKSLKAKNKNWNVKNLWKELNLNAKKNNIDLRRGKNIG